MPSVVRPPHVTHVVARRVIQPGSRADLNRLRPCTMTQAAARVLLENIEAVAASRTLDVPRSNLLDEQRFGLDNLSFLTKLHNLAVDTHREGSGLAARVRVAAHIFSAATQESAVTISDLCTYRAHTVFGFGDRDFDRLFEMGDGDEVRAHLESLASRDPNVAQACREMGWDERPLERPRAPTHGA